MNDFDLQQQLLNQRRQQYAEQQQFRAPQGQMVSGHYVAPNVLQYLAEGLRSVGGMRGQALAEQELKDIGTKRQTAVTEALRNFNTMAQGTPENVPGDGVGPTMPAQPANMRGAYAALMEAPDKQLQQFGMQGQLGLAQQEAQARQKQAEQQRLMTVLQSSTPQQAIAAGVPPELVKNYYESRNFGRDQVEYKDVGGQLVPVTKYGDRPQGVQSLTKTGNPFADLVVRGPDGQIVPNQPLVNAKSTVGAASRAQVNVDARNFHTQESEQSKIYGKQLGEMRGAITQAGYDAPGKLARLDRMEQLLTGIDGGAAAPAMADIASVANSLGIKIDPKLGNKQAAEALAREMAGSLRQPGTGPMTDKDFDNFLKQVPSLSKTADGRREIIGTMRAAIERDQRASQFAREYARQNNGVIDDNFFDSLSSFYAQNPVVTPKMPPKNARGDLFNRADAIIGGGR